MLWVYCKGSRDSCQIAASTSAALGGVATCAAELPWVCARKGRNSQANSFQSLMLAIEINTNPKSEGALSIALDLDNLK
jgi:hypothetical protein